jgi:sulfatase modifying factor 1
MVSQTIKSTRFLILGVILLGIITGCSGGIQSPVSVDPRDINVSIDKTYSLEITPENGGDLQHGLLSLTIQPGAVAEPLTVEVSTLKGNGIIGGISLSPHGVKFSSPIMVIIPLYEPQEPGSSLRIKYRATPEDELVDATLLSGMPVNSLVSDDGKSCLIFIDHFSEYWILASDLVLSDAHFLADTVVCSPKSYGDGSITIPKDWAIFEDKIDQIPGVNDEEGFSYGFNLQLGLVPGLSNSVVRHTGYTEILKNLILQPEFPDKNNVEQIEQLVNEFNILRDFFYFTFETENVTPDHVDEELGLAEKFIDALDIAERSFSGVVHIKKILRSEVAANLLRYLGNLHDFKYAYAFASRLWFICDAVHFLDLIEDDGIFLEKATMDTLLVFAMNYELAKERVLILEPMIQSSSDTALKTAFEVNKMRFIDENLALIFNLWEVVMAKYQEGIVLGVQTFITAVELMDKTLVMLGGAGIFAAIGPEGALIAASFYAAGLIIEYEVWYYDNIVQAYHTLLKCSLAATLRTTIFSNVNYTVQQLEGMTYDERREAVHKSMMKIYLVYYFYSGMSGVYEQWNWTAGMIGWLGSIYSGVDWHQYWELRHQYYVARRDYWAGEYPNLFQFLAEVPPDLFPPIWNNTVGITSAIPGDQSVTVHWGTATDRSSPPVKYLLYKGSWNSTPVEVSNNDPYTFTGLDNGIMCWFGVRCQDSASPPNVDANTNVLSATPNEYSGEMVLIPAGEFIMGGWESYEGGIGPFTVNVPAFYISDHETTNTEYKLFVDATGHREPDDWTNNMYPEGKADHPVIYIDWYDATAYCEWAGCRLPSEIEWEKAARGTDGRIYPWGGEWDENKCRNWYNYDPIYYTCNVWDYPDGRSPYGIYNMAGNVWEWTADWCSTTIYNNYKAGDLTPPLTGTYRVVRGGSWRNDFVDRDGLFRCAYRSADLPDFRRYSWYGFRCARTL